MATRDITLRHVAESIADGTRVDWDDTCEKHPELTGHLSSLRAIEAIGLAHRSYTTPVSSESEPTSQAVGPNESAETADLTTQSVAAGSTVPRQWGHLEIRERIGAGGFGEIFRAYDPNLQKEVALKLPRPDRAPDEVSSRRFLEEARKLAQVHHPNVLTVHGAESHDGRVGLWTDLLEGQTLEEILRTRDLFGSEEATITGIDICQALAAVHAAGLVHRDVKTANVMRERRGKVVLMDFSSAVARPSGPGAEPADSLTGTPHFMAPELFQGELATSVSDVYSLGVLLYRLVSGHFPVEAESIGELRAKHGRGESVPLRDVRPDLPATFIQAVERALATDPMNRFQSAGEMERDLRAALGAISPPSSRDSSVPEPMSWWRRPVLAVPLTIGLVLVLAFAISRIPGLWNGSLEVQASLYRVGDESEERLRPGADVNPGDQLFLEIRGSRAMHVYVINEDAAGQAFVLFPLPELELEKRETILIVASVNRLDELESKLAAIPRAASTHAITVKPQEIADTLVRGIGGVSPGGPDMTRRDPGHLSRVFQDLSSQASDSAGVWFWEIQLNNPGI